MIIFKPAIEEDFDAISKLIKSEEELFLIYPSGKFPLTIEQVNELHEARKDFTVVEQNGKIIGFANLYDYLQDEFVFIGNVIIDKAYRGKGSGTKLIHHMINLARDKYHLPEVRISVFGDNEQALFLYIDLGFELYATELKENQKGKSVILFHMKMSLHT